jgi:hypothetical protein
LDGSLAATARVSASTDTGTGWSSTHNTGCPRREPHSRRRG